MVYFFAVKYQNGSLVLNAYQHQQYLNNNECLKV